MPGEIRGNEFKLANATARAAIPCFKLRRTAQARKLAAGALELFGKFPKQTYLVDELRAELKKATDGASRTPPNKNGDAF